MTRAPDGGFCQGVRGLVGAGGGFIAERAGASSGPRVNERIRARELRVIDDQGNQLGVMTYFDAMKEARKHQKGTQIKEVKFRPSTAEHDYQVRKNQIIEFLGKGYKVKAMIFHRGREMAHQDVGRGKMMRLLKDIEEHALVEFGPRMEANILLALLAPKKGSVSAKPIPASGQA